MSDNHFDIHRILSGSFFSSNEITTSEKLEEAARIDQLERSERREAEDVARDPAMVNLLIPILSYEEYRNFLVEGWKFFKSLFKCPTDGKLHKIFAKAQRKRVIKMLDKWSETMMTHATIKAGEAQARDEKQKEIYKKMLSRLTKQVGKGYKRSKVNGSAQAAVGTLIMLGTEQNRSSSVSTLFSKLGEELYILGAYFIDIAAMQTALLNPAWLALKGVQKESRVNASTAKQFGAIVFNQIQSNDFDVLVDNLLASKEKSTLIIALAMISLTLWYKEEMGGVTSDEMGAVLKGEIELEKETLEHALLDLIFREMKKLTAEEREKIILSLLEFVDSNPTLDSLLAPSRVFRKALGEGHAREHEIDQANRRPI